MMTRSWAALATKAARMAGYDERLINATAQPHKNWKAKRPLYSALASEKGIKLPTLDNALERFFETQENGYRFGKIAV